MSLGSQIYHQPRMFRIVAEAIASEPVEAIFAMGELAGFIPLPSNVRAVKYAPQLAVLARAAAAITHGGANSIMEAFAEGIPLLVSPICNDQHHNARFVSRSGGRDHARPGHRAGSRKCARRSSASSRTGRRAP